MVREHIGKIPVRQKDSHKGDYGRVLVVAGSRGMTGAAYLASQAALYSGSGLVTNAIPEALNDIMEVKLTEVITLPLPGTVAGTLALAAKEVIIAKAALSDVVAIGPGLGTDKEIKQLVRDILSEIKIPVVLDADGINALDGDIDPLRSRNCRTVITPHPGEMARLLGKTVEDVQMSRLDIARSVAEITGAVVCLKGHRTVVADAEGNTYINDTGNSGMATGGTGDVLTGMVASFIGQGLDDYSATVCAVYLHGLAGDVAAEEMGQFSMTPSDMLDYLPEAFERAGI